MRSGDIHEGFETNSEAAKTKHFSRATARGRFKFLDTTECVNGEAPAIAPITKTLG
jgi:hypothetical protein